VEVSGYDGPAALAVKGSARMADVLRRWCATSAATAPAGPRGRALGRRRHVRGGDIARRRAAVHRSSRSHNSGRQAFSAALTELAWRRGSGGRRRRAWSPTTARTSRRGSGTTRPSGARSTPRGRCCCPWPVLTSLRAGELPLRELAGGILSDDELAALTASWSADAPLTAADAALHDELAELLGAAPVEVEEEDDGWDELADLEPARRRSA
jgi:hypothetical protein